MNFVTKFLFSYNFSLTFGWGYVLFKEITTLVNTNFSLTESYGKIEIPLKIVQTAAILEILFCALGLVKSRVDITAMQVSSRLFLVWGICNAYPKIINETPGVPMFVIAWSVTEIIRYGYYACHLAGNVPYFLTWLRYTLFYVLYPLGVTGEVLSILATLRLAYGNSSFVDLPNAMNIQLRYDTVLIGTLLLYFPFFPQLYCHMIAQRKKILGKSHSN